MVRRCSKCKGTKRLCVHHILYKPVVTTVLCFWCHSKITGLNSRGSLIAHGHKTKRLLYTNHLRLVLWNWFIHNSWPEDRKRISNTKVKEILAKANFKIIEWKDAKVNER